jgi:hypothetical protein
VPIGLDVANLIIFISENGEKKSLKKSQIVCVCFPFSEKIIIIIAKLLKWPSFQSPKKPKKKKKLHCFYNWKKVLCS